MLTMKRDDLQCWRALSILAVLLFHIWPQKFPNGYLGVDIFFVISGYLMCSLYSFDSNAFSAIINFYYRRIKRILPVYFSIILITLLFLAKQIFHDEYTLIVENSKWAILLAANYEDLLKKRGYFDTKASFRFFRHCWSLAVEMQFYLVFPVIAITRSYMSLIKYRFLLVAIFSGSIMYQIVSTNAIVQYESLFCRVWQFCVGMFAQTLPVLSLKRIPSFLLLASVVLLFSSLYLPRQIISFVIILISSGTLCMSTSECHPFGTLLRSPKALDYFVTLGNISYILYLIHWPLITYAKYMSPESTFNYFEGFLLLMTSILLSHIAHTFIERPLLKICNSHLNLFICLTILFATSLHLPKHLPKQISTAMVHNQATSNLTSAFWKEVIENFNSSLVLPPTWTTINDIEFALKLREQYMGGTFICKEKKQIPLKNTLLFYCDVMGNPNGTLTALSIGNSFSMNIVSAVSSNPMFKRVINVFVNGEMFPNRDELEKYFIEDLVKALKPDVTLLVQMYLQEYIFTTPIQNIREHNEFKHWNNVLKIIENYTSAIIINKEQIVYPYDISKEYIRKKFYGLPNDSRLKNPQPSSVLETWLTSLECSKCQFFSYRDAFCDGEYCNTLDLASGLPVFRDTTHISPIGIRYIKPFIDKAINRALNIEQIC